MASKAEILKSNLTLELNRNELIHDISHLSFVIKSTGFLFWKKNTLNISGRVGLESEKKAIEEAISRFSGDVKIISNIRVRQDY